jgi:3-oxoacyl-[acyl-carrier-protein] synthase III
MVGIRDVACYLPEGKLESAELHARLGFKPGFLENKVGVETRRIAASDESTSDMAVHAFEKLRERYPDEDFSEVGLVLLCTQNPDFKMPHTASVVSHRIGLPKNLLSFDISLACSGYVSTIVTAKALMNELGVRKALVFTADPYSKIIKPNDKNTIALFGDAASVSVLEVGAPLRICKSTFGNDGSKYEAAIVRGSGTARRNGEAEQFELDGRGIYALLKTEAPPSIRACAAMNGLSLSEIDLFLFHQASAWLLQGLREDLELPEEKVPSNIKHVGNTVSSSIPLLLDRVLSNGGPLPRTMLMSGFGAGLAWASVVIRTEGAV